MWHMIESALIHGLIYRSLSASMRGLGIHGVLVFVAVGILGTAVAHVVMRGLIGRHRSRHR